QSTTVPGWFAGIAGKTGSITIGGHKFTGRARGLGGNSAGKGTAQLETRTNGAKVGGLNFAHADQTNINEGFANILRDTAHALGTELNITSGYRSPDHNEKVGGAKNSQHMHGDAVDISMKGM